MTAFLIVGLAGLALVLVSLVVGDLFDGVLDALAGDVFSSAVLGGFVSAFGFGAALTTPYAPPVVAVAVGTAAGGVFGWFAWWLTRLVRDGSSDATITIDDTIGHEGKVLSHIPAEGYGTVRIQVGGHVLQLNARASVEIESGTPVHVTAALSPTAVTVAPIWSGLPPTPALNQEP